MDVGSPLTHGLVDHLLHQHDNGGIVDILLRGIYFLHIQILLLGIRLQGRGNFILTIIFVNGQHNVSGGGHRRLHLTVGDNGNIILGIHIHGISHGHPQHIHAVRVFYGEDFILLEHIHRDQVQDLLADRDGGQVDQFNMQLGTQGHGNLLFCDNALLHQHFSQFLAAALLQIQRLQQLCIGNRLAV